MMRSMVLGALEVCSVPKTRCPVSAAVSASEMVSRSRISPIRITSGSSRSALHSARPAAVQEDVDAEAPLVGQLAGEVDLVLVAELRALTVVHDRVDERVHVLRREGGVLGAHEVAVDAKHRRLARAQVQVRGALLGGLA